MSGQNWLRKNTIFVSPHKKSQYTPSQGKTKKIVGVTKKYAGIIGRSLRRTCTVIGAMVLFSAVSTLYLSFKILGDQAKPQGLMDNAVVILKLEDEIQEKSSPVNFFGNEEAMSLPDMIAAIDAASVDSRVKALVLSLRPGRYSLAHLQELRAAVQRFVKTGKRATVYASSYGETGSGIGAYYLAAVFPEIWMQPVGVVSIHGIRAEMPYAKNLLSKFGIETHFSQRKEYKNAMENMTASEMSAPSRESTTAMINDMMQQIKSGIVESRPRLKTNLNSLIDKGILTDQESLQTGLIDKLNYSDALMDDLRKKITGDEDSKDVGFYLANTYYSAIKREKKSQEMLHKATKKKIALVHVSGAIVDKAENSSPYNMGNIPNGADRISQAIYDAAEDKDIVAIVVRVDSPGGSPTASETIRRAIVRAKEKYKKPVIISMGSVAASGGYWVATDADKIYALPATLTGSIGVVGGKFDLAGMWQKMDINWQSIGSSQNDGMWSMNQGFTESEQARFDAMLDNIYAHFQKRVADGRKLSLARVEEISRGRVWTGQQALKLGLVDQLGGMDIVLTDLAKKLGVQGRDDLDIIEMPKPETPFEQIMALFEVQAGISLPQWMNDGAMADLLKTIWMGQRNPMDIMVYNAPSALK